MINELIREIKYCLDHDCCMAGLALALTLPDICGKALFPIAGIGERYTKWFDEYIGQYEHDDEHIKLGIPYLNGKLIYSLRCSVLHQGNPNIDEQKLDIDHFELQYNKDERSTIIAGVSEAEIIKDENGNEKAIHKKICINVRSLCWKICLCAEKCYETNKEKFNFFNYNLVNTDFRTRRIFGMKAR